MLAQSYYSTTQAATYLGLSRRTLEGFRVKGGGPVFVKAGRRCLYKIEDLEAWAASRRRTSTSGYVNSNDSVV